VQCLKVTSEIVADKNSAEYRAQRNCRNHGLSSTELKVTSEIMSDLNSVVYRAQKILLK
jgi:hypothetical protein